MIRMKTKLTIITLVHIFSINGAEATEPLCVPNHCKGDICANNTCPNGCNDGYMQPTCLYNCSKSCHLLKCKDDGTGVGICTDGCIPGFWGETCKSPCPHSCKVCSRETGENCTSCLEFQYGNVCEKSCRADCSITGCNMGGSCKQGDLIACTNGKYGLKCLLGCSSGCKYDVCNRSSGNCLHGCKRGYFGEKCESRCNPYCKRQICDSRGSCTEGCDTSYFGDDCDLICSQNCRLQVCDRLTGDCTNGCNDGFYGTLCNMTCISGCYVCHGRTGECLQIKDSHNNESNGNSSKSQPNDRNLTAYYVLGSSGMFMLCGTVTFILIKRYWNIMCGKAPRSARNVGQHEFVSVTSRSLPNPPELQYHYDYSEINEDQMDYRSPHERCITPDLHAPAISDSHLEKPQSPSPLLEAIGNEGISETLTGSRSLEQDQQDEQTHETKAASLSVPESEEAVESSLVNERRNTCYEELSRPDNDEDKKYLTPMRRLKDMQLASHKKQDGFIS